jgi:hypothetical protein
MIELFTALTLLGGGFIVGLAVAMVVMVTGKKDDNEWDDSEW